MMRFTVIMLQIIIFIIASAWCVAIQLSAYLRCGGIKMSALAVTMIPFLIAPLITYCLPRQTNKKNLFYIAGAMLLFCLGGAIAFRAQNVPTVFTSESQNELISQVKNNYLMASTGGKSPQASPYVFDSTTQGMLSIIVLLVFCLVILGITRKSTVVSDVLGHAPNRNIVALALLPYVCAIISRYVFHSEMGNEILYQLCKLSTIALAATGASIIARKAVVIQERNFHEYNTKKNRENETIMFQLFPELSDRQNSLGFFAFLMVCSFFPVVIFFIFQDLGLLILVFCVSVGLIALTPTSAGVKCVFAIMSLMWITVAVPLETVIHFDDFHDSMGIYSKVTGESSGELKNETDNRIVSHAEAIAGTSVAGWWGFNTYTIIGHHRGRDVIPTDASINAIDVVNVIGLFGLISIVVFFALMTAGVLEGDIRSKTGTLKLPFWVYGCALWLMGEAAVHIASSFLLLPPGRTRLPFVDHSLLAIIIWSAMVGVVALPEQAE
jgi:hypothetical protein